MGIPDTIYIGVGAVLGAFINTFLSRAQTISGFRQQWINDVRDPFALFLNKADNYADSVLENKSNLTKEGIKNETSDKRRELLHHINKIKLYLNRQEGKHKVLLNGLCVLLNSITTLESREEYEKARREVTHQMQDILKNEWSRVRDGEWLWQLKKLMKKT